MAIRTHQSISGFVASDPQLSQTERGAPRPVHNTHTSEQAQAADIQAGAGLTLYAGGNANYQGSTLHSGADLTLLAGKNLTLGADLLTSTHQQSGTREQSQTLQGGHTSVTSA